ncbi:piggyBac transposable element-derived protein 3-like [Macrobrachium rosenbergii]|uniref:piggyBac transposable element-derived protein 3-like n=1 Tax=Macrobrachium rosenbergii TaxID=79674 RepID=UPI0034D4D922
MVKLPRVENVDRMQSRSKNNFGNKMPIFSGAKWTKVALPIDPDVIVTPYDYLKLFLPDSCIEKIVKETKRYAGQCNNQGFRAIVSIDMIRASHAIMYLTGYVSASQRHMYWQRHEDTNNALVIKAMSRNTFDDVMRYTHFANVDKPNYNDPFWKVAMLFNTINDTAAKYVEKPEFVSIGESMVRYFGPHPLKQFMRGKPTCFGFKVWVMATTSGELISCTPYGGAKTQMFSYGMGQGPDVVYGLVQKANLPEG